MLPTQVCFSIYAFTCTYALFYIMLYQCPWSFILRSNILFHYFFLMYICIHICIHTCLHAVFYEALSNRVMAEHNLNRRSSRSHVIYSFYITVTRQVEPSSPSKKRQSSTPSSSSNQDVVESKLHLVDLAGKLWWWNIITIIIVSCHQHHRFYYCHYRYNNHDHLIIILLSFSLLSLSL